VKGLVPAAAKVQSRAPLPSLSPPPPKCAPVASP